MVSILDERLHNGFVAAVMNNFVCSRVEMTVKSTQDTSSGGPESLVNNIILLTY